MVCRKPSSQLKVIGHLMIAVVAVILLYDVSFAISPRFEHLTVNDGLSQGSVECVIQDEQGFLWFCTRDGLNRYDGRSFRKFKHDRVDSSSLSNNFVRQMVPGREGEYWLATKFGLNRFDPNTELFASYHHHPNDPSSLSSDNIMRVLLDHAGVLWVGTWGGGLNSSGGPDGGFRRYASELDDARFVRGNIINSLLESRDHTLWVAAITGLYSSPPDRSEFVRHDLEDGTHDGDRDNIVVCIYEDAAGIIWLGTYTGLIRFDPRSGSRKRFALDPSDPKNVPANQIRFIVAGPEPDGDRLWLGTAARGMVVFDKASGDMSFFGHDPANPVSLSHNSLWSGYRDSGGTMWIGTAGKGVDKMTPMASRFDHVNQATLQGDKWGSDSIWSFCEDRVGNLWVGTSNGLGLYETGPGRWRAITHDADDGNSIGDGPVYSILADRTGAIWFATGSSGLSRLAGPGPDGSYGDIEFEHFRFDAQDPTSLSADRLFSLYEDRDGRLWVGTVDEGVDVRDPEQEGFTHYRPDKTAANSISDNGVECIYQDSSGAYWFGTLAGGLNRLDPVTGVFRHFVHNPDNPRSLSSNHVTSLIEDRDKNLWVSTAEGLNRLEPDGESFTHYFESDGLPNSYIYGLLLDDDGKLWMSTNFGLARFEAETETFRNFTTRDGLQGNEFNGGAFYRSPGDEMFFGGHNGFNRFRSEDIKDNPLAPPVVLTSIQVLGQPLDAPGAVHAVTSLDLSHHDYYFSFEFAALDYWAPERNRYEYKLAGLDEEWVDAGNRNFVTYTHLDPGHYEFRVRASNSDGVWNDVGISLPITITPPFWETPWFLGLVALALGLLAYGLHLIRVRRLLQIERLRTRISADLHDEIAANLSSIAMFSGILESEQGLNPQGKSAQLLPRIRELAENSVGSIRDIIWALNKESETLSELLIRLRDRTVVTCRAQGIVLDFEIPPDQILPSHDLRLGQRQHLRLALKEALHNAVKHSGGTKMGFRVQYVDGTLTVTIEDDGNGFDPNRAGGGNGLNTMKMRVERLGGRFALESKPNTGTTIRISVPI